MNWGLNILWRNPANKSLPKCYVLHGIPIQKPGTIKCNNLSREPFRNKCRVGSPDLHVFKRTVSTFVWADCRKLAQKVSGETATQPIVEPVASNYQVSNTAMATLSCSVEIDRKKFVRLER